MKSQRIIKKTIKTEKLPQGQTSTVASHKFKSNISSTGSNEYTVKETTIEKNINQIIISEDEMILV